MIKRMKRKNKKRRIHNKHVIILASVLAALVAVTLLAWLLSTTIDSQSAKLGRLVTFYDRGQEHVILTHASTVQNALKDANIAVTPHDVVEPAIDSKLLSTDSVVIIYRARPVLVIDGALRQKVVTPAAAPREIMTAAAMDPLGDKDKTTVTTGDFIADGASTVLTVTRAILTPAKVVYVPKPNALTLSKGAQLNVDSDGVAHRETYYDLPMNVVIGSCGGGGYTIRPADGAKVDKDGYILVAASYGIYPRCSIVETSMGPGKVYDTGGFVKRYPHGFDLATDWTNRDGR
jgi:hypothetical protein